MIDLLKDKKVIFFDVGYTLDAPASGNWMFTNQFLELAGEKLKKKSKEDKRAAFQKETMRCTNSNRPQLRALAMIENSSSFPLGWSLYFFV